MKMEIRVFESEESIISGRFISYNYYVPLLCASSAQVRGLQSPHSAPTGSEDDEVRHSVSPSATDTNRLFHQTSIFFPHLRTLHTDIQVTFRTSGGGAPATNAYAILNLI